MVLKSRPSGSWILSHLLYANAIYSMTLSQSMNVEPLKSYNDHFGIVTSDIFSHVAKVLPECLMASICPICVCLIKKEMWCDCLRDNFSQETKLHRN